MRKAMKLTEKERLENGRVSVSFDPARKEIYATDSIDQHNMPAFISKSKRGIAKAWVAVAVAWDETTTMFQVMDILSDNGVACHYWCRMD